MKLHGSVLFWVLKFYDRFFTPWRIRCWMCQAKLVHDILPQFYCIRLLRSVGEIGVCAFAAWSTSFSCSISPYIFSIWHKNRFKQRNSTVLAARLNHYCFYSSEISWLSGKAIHATTSISKYLFYFLFYKYFDLRQEVVTGKGQIMQAARFIYTWTNRIKADRKGKPVQSLIDHQPKGEIYVHIWTLESFNNQ